MRAFEGGEPGVTRPLTGENPGRDAGADGRCSSRLFLSSGRRSVLSPSGGASSSSKEAMAAGGSVQRCILHPWLRRLRSGRGPLFAFSTAAQQRSTGDDCGPEDPRDEPRHLLDRNTSEARTVKLEEQVRDLTARYQKALMDSENVRRRTQKFVEDAKLFGIQSFCRDLVEVADILEKTTGSTMQGEHSDPDSALRKICESLSLVESKLQSIFTKHGLQKMNPVGGRYDPYDHRIVCHVPVEGAKPGTVALVTLDGYKLHGRTVRHAHVGVAVESQEGS